ncbi:hypothetical protein E2C01_045742 [Portunus trituberculatus]|uniref:Uncharacterized protein n=1 Tax=Portunus trituberculatus TaxID=210409 RepID=A0A5B7G390_PORTR|nr:hypothetical protein [Portunus trituberculatus]
MDINSDVSTGPSVYLRVKWCVCVCVCGETHQPGSVLDSFLLCSNVSLRIKEASSLVPQEQELKRIYKEKLTEKSYREKVVEAERLANDGECLSSLD